MTETEVVLANDDARLRRLLDALDAGPDAVDVAAIESDDQLVAFAAALAGSTHLVLVRAGGDDVDQSVTLALGDRVAVACREVEGGLGVSGLRAADLLHWFADIAGVADMAGAMAGDFVELSPEILAADPSTHVLDSYDTAQRAFIVDRASRRRWCSVGVVVRDDPGVVVSRAWFEGASGRLWAIEPLDTDAVDLGESEPTDVAAAACSVSPATVFASVAGLLAAAGWEFAEELLATIFEPATVDAD